MLTALRTGYRDNTETIDALSEFEDCIEITSDCKASKMPAMQEKEN